MYVKNNILVYICLLKCMMYVYYYEFVILYIYVQKENNNINCINV